MRSFLLSILLIVVMNGFAQTLKPADSTITAIREGKMTLPQHYFRVSLGYRFRAGIGVNTVTNQIPGSTKKMYENASFGSGFPFSIAYGGYLSKGLILELDMTFKRGRSQPLISTYYNQVDNLKTDQQFVYIFNEVQFSPRFICETPVEKSILQFKLGPVFSFGNSRSEIEEGYTNEFGNHYTGHFEWDIKMKPAVGFLGALGVRRQVDKNVSLFADFTFIQLGRWWEGSKRTVATIEGKDIMDQFTESEKVSLAVQEIDTEEVQDPDSPTKYLRSKTEYSSIGFSCGLIYHF